MPEEKEIPADLVKEIKRLKNKKHYVKRSLKELQQLVLDAPEAVNEIQARFEKCKFLHDASVDFEADIYDCDYEDEFNKLNTETEAINQLFVQLDSKIEKSVATIAQANAEATANSQIKLPLLSLPTFSGQYEHWLSFKDSFMSLVDCNAGLPNIQKLQYLRSALTGNALDVIKSLDTNAVNYDAALKLLADRFENKRAIARNHVRAIFELAPVSKDILSGIRNLLDNSSQHLRCLKALERPIESWDDMLIYVITTKLNPGIRKEWEGKKPAADLPTFKELQKFLTEKCQILEAVQGSEPCQKSNVKAFSANIKPFKCYYCAKEHSVFECEAFLGLSVEQRLEAVQSKKLCINCLKPNHVAKDCKSKKCKRCDHLHHTLLHRERKQHETETKVEKITLHAGSFANTQICEILLSTCVVQILNKDGNFIEARALLDSGSQINLISSKLLKRLKINTERTSICLNGITGKATTINQVAATKIKSRHSSFEIAVRLFVTGKITNLLPARELNKQTVNIPSDVSLADPKFWLPGEIDLLIGAEVFYDLMSDGQLATSTKGISLKNTKLGWVVTGSLPPAPQVAISCFLNTFEELNKSVKQFWELESEVVVNSFKTREESRCEEHFLDNCERDNTGRFSVALPFKRDKPDLGDSYETAKRCLISLERKLKKNPKLCSDYKTFLSEYESLGHMSKVQDQDETERGEGYYMPHHAVLKEDSLTTKLRVVFNASKATTNGKSLNDELMIGPVLQQDIFDILLRFRSHQFVLTADVAKMYRQINVNEKDIKYQRILWRENAQENISTYELKTVTYGTASASFLAVRCLLELAKTSDPEIARIINSDFILLYFSLVQLQNIQKKLTSTLSNGGFELRKWASNNHAAMLDLSNKSEQNLVLSHEESVKTLGIQWNANTDMLEYTTAINFESKQVTKRSMLSAIAQIYDPLGLLGPVVVVAKKLMQELWKEKLAWDENVPATVNSAWREFIRQLCDMKTFCIPRKAIAANSISIELHGFCDASEMAYGACIYARTQCSSNEQIEVSLLTSKSRVAPLKVQSLPRLELCAALLLTRLQKRVTKSLDRTIAKTSYYTDSMITLGWIRGCPARWKTFVANRVAEIQTLTDINDWHHVGTAENPADLISRGMLPSNLVNSKIWWHGPKFLSTGTLLLDCEETIPESLPEVKTCLNIKIKGEIDNYIFDKFSEFLKLIRVTAYCFRFKLNCLNSASKLNGPLSVEELNAAETMLVRTVQRASFEPELKALSGQKVTHDKGNLRSLNPFLDSDGIIRVGGRLTNSNLEHDAKHPIVLPARHLFSLLLMRYEHERNLHAGCQATLAAVRNKYWPLAARNTIRGIIHGCVKCFRANPVSSQPIMGDLPIDRVNSSRPFLKSGIDYFGPLYIKEGTRKTSKLKKAYAAVFVCMATKGVHIELVADLTTAAFLAALQRFVGRRGLPTDIYSDNGTNFKGADNELKRVIKDPKVQNSLSNQKITWHFIPPRTPHMGGLWEASVKSAKRHLSRIIANANLRYDEMTTLLVHIEAILNSRPLIPLSSDPKDLSVLTPGHFLIGDALNKIPARNLLEVPVNRLTRWQRITQLKQHFWKRWSQEYLQELQTRNKWKTSKGILAQPGLLVLIKEDNMSPGQWKVGRIQEVHPGADGIVRAATVRTARDVLKRSVNRLCFFPDSSSNE